MSHDLLAQLLKRVEGQNKLIEYEQKLVVGK